MIFSEIYSAYYNAVACILKEAVRGPVTPEKMRKIIAANAFDESVLTILPALSEGRWPLLRNDGTTPLSHTPTMPLTRLQKQWLNSIFRDPRMRLFLGDDREDACGPEGSVQDGGCPEKPSAAGAQEGESGLPFPEEKVLFAREDYYIYDAYADGDPYEDPSYVRNFRTILRAIEDKRALRVRMVNRHGNLMSVVMIPGYLEYSEKDDKFRVYGYSKRRDDIINLARIESVEVCEPKEWMKKGNPRSGKKAKVEFLLLDERKALERVMLHFAHFEKTAERIGKKNYRVTIYYDGYDETEMVIRILSFGPLVKVVEPARFVELIRARLLKQKDLW
ncbi:MAG: WYL domain-containing protein [Clostridiales bacterium]|nr:WYL domain-containing protein [Clostridiales bacterium]